MRASFKCGACLTISFAPKQRRKSRESFMRRKTIRQALAASVAGALLFGAPAHAADADKTVVMKLATATLNDGQYHWMQTYVALIQKDSGGRIKGEIYPNSELGSIPREIEGTQFGAIQAYIGPPEFLVGLDERFQIMS